MENTTKAARLLRNFMDANNLSLAALAERCGLTANEVSALLQQTGRQTSLKVAVAIEDGTGGAVPVRDWLVVG